MEENQLSSLNNQVVSSQILISTDLKKICSGGNKKTTKNTSNKIPLWLFLSCIFFKLIFSFIPKRDISWLCQLGDAYRIFCRKTKELKHLGLPWLLQARKWKVQGNSLRMMVPVPLRVQGLNCTQHVISYGSFWQGLYEYIERSFPQSLERILTTIHFQITRKLLE